MEPNGNLGLGSRICNLKSEIRQAFLSKECLSQALTEVREGPSGIFEDKPHTEVKASSVSWRQKEAWQNDLCGWSEMSKGVKLGEGLSKLPGGGRHLCPWYNFGFRLRRTPLEDFAEEPHDTTFNRITQAAVT